jgi:hypothetical protein
MTRHITLLAFFAFSFLSQAQIFSREKLANLENFDKQRWTWGYFLGLNRYDYKFDYDQPTEEIQTEPQIGFNVGLIGDLRLNEYMNLRLEPGIFFVNRTLTFPDAGISDPAQREREVVSSYINVPLLLKVSTKRLNNWKPFVVGGLSYSWNLSSEEGNPDDNLTGTFRQTTNTLNYELGFGIDFYLFYFKFTPSIRGVFAITDELVRDNDPNSPYTGNVDAMLSRGVFINFTFQ